MPRLGSCSGLLRSLGGEAFGGARLIWRRAYVVLRGWPAFFLDLSEQPSLLRDRDQQRLARPFALGALHSADRHTELAADRTVLAAERTDAAWVRTGLVSLAADIGAKKARGGVLPEWVVVLTGSVLVGFAAFCFVAAIWRELFPGTLPPRPDVRRLPRVLLFALNGFHALVALAVLFGIWFGRTSGTGPRYPA